MDKETSDAIGTKEATKSVPEEIQGNRAWKNVRENSGIYIVVATIIFGLGAGIWAIFVFGFGALQAQLATVGDRVTTVDERVTTVDGRFTTVNNRFDTVHTEITHIRTEVGQEMRFVREKIESIDEEIKQLNRDLGELDGRMTDNANDDAIIASTAD